MGLTFLPEKSVCTCRRLLISVQGMPCQAAGTVASSHEGCSNPGKRGGKIVRSRLPNPPASPTGFGRNLLAYFGGSWGDPESRSQLSFELSPAILG